MPFILTFVTLKMKNALIIITALVLLASCKAKKETQLMPAVAEVDTFRVELKTLADSFAYAYGAYVGGMLNSTRIKEIDWDIFKAAYFEALKKGDTGLLFDKEKIGEVLNNYSLYAKYGENKRTGEEFIEMNKGRGFTQTPSGLLFRMTKTGNGVKPNLADTVLVHYTGRFINGTIFDSNIGKDAYKTSMNSGSIKGFLEALSMMEVGSEAEVIIPYHLAYGKEGNRNPYTGEMQMEPYQTLMFTLILDGIQR
jgi:FKBP-type peptidyl-prolyl cis-trans isomerase FklB